VDTAINDTYRDFKHLSRFERAGIDFEIETRASQTGSVLIMAPHGGKIEPGTEVVASAIAGNEHSFYCFRGIKPAGNHVLHIGSERFDEPAAVGMMASANIVISVHGLRDTGQKIIVGGLNKYLGQSIKEVLGSLGFIVELQNFGRFSGTNTFNICNRGRSQQGIQLELSRGLRDFLSTNGERLKKFSEGIRKVIKAIE
jgi:phage replication-related protein YjqB (UPF0714/DUF867 family)